MSKLFGGKHSVQDRMLKADKRLGKTTGASKGGKPASEATLSLKGSNPLKKKVAVTWEKKF